MWQCSQQHTNREEAKFCSKCGEKRVERIVCSSCGAILEPDDAFCTACGHKRESAPAIPPEPAPVPEPIPSEPVPTPEPSEPAPAPEHKESFSFSFAGMTIESAEDEAAKSVKAKPPAKSAAPRSSTVNAALSFLLIGAVLGAAIYFLSR